MYRFSSSGYSDESSPYIVSTPRTASAPRMRMAGGRPFGDELEREQERQANLLGSYLNSAAQVKAAEYGQAPTQASRQPSIGDQLLGGLAKPLGTLASGLVGGLFGGGFSGGGGGGLSSGFNAGTSSAIDTGAAGWGNAFGTNLSF